MSRAEQRVTSASRSAPKVQAMFAAIAHRYDLANHLLSGGLDWIWRRRVTRIVQGWAPTCILDLATGSGDLALALRSACPGASVTGADFSEAMLAEARRKGLHEVVLADALNLPFAEETFDVVTVAFGLRNMESWPRALQEMARVLRPGGRCLILDFAMPRPPMRWLYRLYLRIALPRLAGWLTGQRDAYEYLGVSIETFPSGPAMCALLSNAGFRATKSESLSGGIVAIYTGLRASG